MADSPVLPPRSSHRTASRNPSRPPKRKLLSSVDSCPVRAWRLVDVDGTRREQGRASPRAFRSTSTRCGLGIFWIRRNRSSLSLVFYVRFSELWRVLKQERRGRNVMSSKSKRARFRFPSVVPPLPLPSNSLSLKQATVSSFLPSSKLKQNSSLSL